MNVFINDKLQSVDQDTCLTNLLDNLGMLKKKGIAVAVNNRVIQKNDWQNNKLKENDKIIIITATQGG